MFCDEFEAELVDVEPLAHFQIADKDDDVLDAQVGLFASRAKHGAVRPREEGIAGHRRDYNVQLLKSADHTQNLASGRGANFSFSAQLRVPNAPPLRFWQRWEPRTDTFWPSSRNRVEGSMVPTFHIKRERWAAKGKGISSSNAEARATRSR